MELAKAKKIDNKVDRNIWTKKVAMIFGKILKRINITYQPNTLYFGHYPETTTNVYGHKNFINDEMINYNSINFKDIVSGGFHLLMLTPEGTLYSKGNGNFGQLGHGSELKESNEPLCIEPLPKIKYISSGYAYNCVISEDGDIYSWGAGENGRLGLGDNSDISKPTLVTSDVKFKSVACGSTFTVALSTDNEIYSWGQYCATGHIEEEDCLVPKKIKIFEGRLFHKISIGPGSYHVLALSASGKLFSWGHNRCGQLGIGSNIGEKENEEDFYVRIPFMVSKCMVGDKLMDISNYEIMDIASGWGHSMFLTNNGKVFASGRNHQEQLGFPKECSMINGRDIKYFPYFKQVDFLANYYIIKIFAGGEHSAALTDDYRLIFWGNVDYDNNLDEEIVEETIYPDNMEGVFITKQFTNLSDVHLGNECNCIISSN